MRRRAFHSRRCEGRFSADGCGGGRAAATLPIRMLSSARQRGRSRDLLTRASDIAAFYASLMHDVPYPSLNLAIIESNVPGGHSPAYLVVLNQPLPTTPFVWRDDPAAFDEYPDFFIAHEMAHQWWGQAVGWKNYHEQWLSEGWRSTSPCSTRSTRRARRCSDRSCAN
jgi:hypothetical protein